MDFANKLIQSHTITTTTSTKYITKNYKIELSDLLDLSAQQQSKLGYHVYAFSDNQRRPNSLSLSLMKTFYKEQPSNKKVKKHCHNSLGD
jgi:hypothetical protein